MHTLSPSIDRLGAALRALRQTHTVSSAAEQAALGIKCLSTVMRHLADEGLPEEDLQPLMQLESLLQRPQPAAAQPPSAPAPERRKRRPPSDALLARVTAVIDLLVKAGYEEGEAAQLVTRRLLAAGVAPPTKGGDARGWKRLLEWRNDFTHGSPSEDAREEYQDFLKLLEAIPPSERVRRVLDHHLWDRRRKPR